jgi:UTP--glucose-1-phosphate uridylyltransferase
MKISKAVITAAGRDQRSLPLQTLVDRDGRQKAALRIVVEEALAAGVEEIAVVVHPDDVEGYAAVVTEVAGRVTFLEQPRPRGYGHALHCAREFTGDDPFLHLVSDHLCVSTGSRHCAEQLVQIAQSESGAVSAVQATRESVLPQYGAVGGRPVRGSSGLFEIETVLEKPTPTQAEQELIVPGMRAGHYLCFFGMHVLTPQVMELLDRRVTEASADEPIPLSPALAELAGRERYLALEIQGHRYNIGVQYGLFLAQLALIMRGGDRDEVLAQIVEMLATREGR